MSRKKMSDPTQKIVMIQVGIPKWQEEWILSNETFNVHEFLRSKLSNYIHLKQEVMVNAKTAK